MRHTIEHDLDPAVARRALELAFADYYRRFARHEPTLVWQGESQGYFTFKALGRTVTGTLTLGPHRIAVDLDVPLLLRPFEGRARRAVEDEVHRWAARARAGQL